MKLQTKLALFFGVMLILACVVAGVDQYAVNSVKNREENGAGRGIRRTGGKEGRA